MMSKWIDILVIAVLAAFCLQNYKNRQRQKRGQLHISEANKILKKCGLGTIPTHSRSSARFSKDSSIQSAREAASHAETAGYAASLADLTKIPGKVSTQTRGLEADEASTRTNRTSGIRTEQGSQDREEQP